ncbi:valine--tRNA ligase [Streptomyces sp. MI02-7b]|uniref:valine--tRNA ligase n=1 Tax=Streptomyces sp. MI02-7b TaxID=462941 RepID=UPI0029AAD0D8|nr:valine--tRNA ligase [Streptomyces sp. MI02-7b]MDX3071429.1 valine--tRNA ligase [Streptomyces sp. MI02-7b]
MTHSPRRHHDVPDKPSLEGLEATWSRRWDETGVHRFDRSRPREEIFSIDTPPPTASGTLHIGHVFSYTHTDTVARYHRMRGKSVFYPMGWDDNGLPTERRVQNVYGVTCDASLPYDPDFTPPEHPGARQVPVSRRNFIELCERLTAEDERAFEDLWRRLGLSVDWTLTYRTVGDRSRAASQRAFLRNLARGEAYTAEAPTLWDTTFRTAVAQAELEDRERPGAYHRLAFHRPDGERVVVATTRPELLPACVALVAHPDDPRYQALFGTTVRTPVLGVEVPVHAHRLADPDKGTGIAMVCTFGDTTDVTWWRELRLPTRPVLGRGGRFLPDPPSGLDSEQARTAYAHLAGATAFTARERLLGLLRASGDLEGEPEPVLHAVKFYEKGDRPLEIVTTRQWYLRNGGRDEALRARLLERGRELRWHPEHMRVRYESWVGGLNGDWLISRQRWFGVPVPVWYPLDAAGEPVHDRPLVPDESALPVDPGSDVPPGYREEQRGRPGGFTGDPDVMDTWATSSLTPQIAGGWGTDDELFAKVFPMDLRPQAHEIIRTWLFSTVLRADTEHGTLPWRHAAISGWILDPDRKKMSKSRGKAITPGDLLEQHGSDAVRYWAASARPGTDTAFDTGQMRIGRRLAIKILNASRFVLTSGAGAGTATGGAADRAGGAEAVTTPLDRALLATLADTVRAVTDAMEEFDHARALERAETFFWQFCDDYVELVKSRAYAGDASALATLSLALSVQLRLFAPFLPFVAEEVWSWWQEGSVHRAPWPDADAFGAAAADGDPLVLDTARAAVTAVRRAKSEARLSMRTDVAGLVVTGPAAALARFALVADEVRAAGRAGSVELAPPSGDALGVEVRF